MARTQWLAPLLAGARSQDRILGAIGGAVAIAITALVTAPFAHEGQLVFLLGSLGASTVLLFVVPSSPMASPWAAIGGTLVSLACATGVVKLLGAGAVPAGLAVGVAIIAMSALRCLHPPGGGYALSVVIGGPAAAGWMTLALPGAVAAATLVLCALLFHRFVSGHPYPRHAPAPAQPLFHPEDIDAALAEQGEAFDIAREDLDALLEAAERHARARAARPVRRR